MNTFWHQLIDFARIVGARDRLRCPRCRAVGTWKPHGGWLDVWLGGDTRGIRRWICKWCGLYRDAQGQDEAVVGRGGRHWELLRHWPSGRTPKQMCDGAHPWAG